MVDHAKSKRGPAMLTARQEGRLREQNQWLEKYVKTACWVILDCLATIPRELLTKSS